MFVVFAFAVLDVVADIFCDVFVVSFVFVVAAAADRRRRRA